jgi:hypothetical protein
LYVTHATVALYPRALIWIQAERSKKSNEKQNRKTKRKSKRSASPKSKSPVVCHTCNLAIAHRALILFRPNTLRNQTKSKTGKRNERETLKSQSNLELFPVW